MRISKQLKRQKLFKAQDGEGHYCHKPMQIEVQSGGRLPNNYATIEHLRDRFDPTRNEPNHQQDKRIVLACNKCNNDRGREREKEMGVYELRLRSRRFGLSSLLDIRIEMI